MNWWLNVQNYIRHFKRWHNIKHFLVLLIQASYCGIRCLITFPFLAPWGFASYFFAPFFQSTRRSLLGSSNYIPEFFTPCYLQIKKWKCSTPTNLRVNGGNTALIRQRIKKTQTRERDINEEEALRRALTKAVGVKQRGKGKLAERHEEETSWGTWLKMETRFHLGDSGSVV